MDKVIGVGAASARSASMQQFIELKQDTEFWFVFITAVMIALYVGYYIGEYENECNARKTD